MKYVIYMKELTKKMCKYFTIYIDVESKSVICPTSRLNFDILKKVIESRIDYKIKTG